MSKQHASSRCPECEGISRRQFIRSAGTAAIALAAGSRLAAAEPSPAEAAVTRLAATLTEEQRKVALLPFNDPRLTRAGANWHVIPQKIGALYTPEQQKLIHEIVRGVTSGEGYERFLRQMQDDDGGFGNFSAAIFGTPGAGPCAFLLTGRHLTLRAEGNALPDAVFGGPIIYGHGAAGNQKANLFYYQTKSANEVFQALDGKQRERALLPTAPAESSIEIKKSGFNGIAIGELSADQKTLVERVMKQLLAPYREADVHEAMHALKANGGLEKVHLSFYRNDDLGNDQEWDIWRLEGPTLVWHFRGAPHVHTWVNFRTKPAA